MHALRFALIASAFAVIACGGGANADVAESFPLDLTGPRPTAQLVIGESEPVTAIFDTGAAASVLKRGYAERLGLPNEGSAMAGGPGSTPVPGFRTTIRDGSLGGVSFAPAMAVAFDIPLPLENVEAVISPDVFRGRLIRFDFAASRAEVLPMTAEHIPQAEAQPYRGEQSHGRLRQTPSVSITLPTGASIDAVLDTGSARGLSLPLTLAQSLTLAEPLTPDAPQRLVGVEYAAFRARIAGDVRVGPVTLHNPEARFIEGSDVAIVGMQVLRETIVVIDPQGLRSWVLAP
jgi:hypothetical protein